jgi:y4mF family transcriptional regulator
MAPTTSPGRDQAERFGAMVRERRKAAKLSQDELALATGVGRRFIIDLEAGKPSCELGRALHVAHAVGLRLFQGRTQDAANMPLLPDLPDDGEPAS